MLCNQEASGPGRRWRGAVRGLPARATAPCLHPVPCPLKPENPHSPGQGAVGSREGRSGTRAGSSSALSGRPRRGTSHRTRVLSHSHTRSTRGTGDPQAPQPSGRSRRRSPRGGKPRAPRPNVPRGGAACAKEGRGPGWAGPGRGEHAVPPPGESRSGPAHYGMPLPVWEGSHRPSATRGYGRLPEVGEEPVHCTAFLDLSWPAPHSGGGDFPKPPPAQCPFFIDSVH
ncbi:unnamed protein product [Rangifer tarandus platyrhynchus]|uniref:Uncharacterized protein n=1 Tax=Rangifer tarandus platyrhynchus TaxID=3082113 RepID=A0ABN8ZVC4_RANTA|nr:unnamed protein product [Rangifer tarandus platyrhynchus]